MEENRAKLCKGLDGKPLFSALYGTYTVTLNELKAVFKVSEQARQRGAVNITTVESMAEDDDFWEAKGCKWHISNNTSQTAKKSTKPVPTSAPVKLPPKSVLICNFFTPLRTTDMVTETTGADNLLWQKEAPRKPGTPPPIMMASTTNLIQLQSDLKDHVKGQYEFQNTQN
jgi:hypothetical protein